MSSSRLFFVALGMVAAAALTVLTSEALSANPGIESARLLVTERSTPDRPALDTEMNSLQTMHERLLAASSDAERRVLLAQSERVMSDGVAMMRRMKPNLSVPGTGKVVPEQVSETDFDAIKDFLGLMELLVQLKEDQDAIMVPAGSNESHRPAPIQPATPAAAALKAYA